MRTGQRLPEGPVLVCGLARSGQAASRALAEAGLEVIAVDAGSPDGAAGLSEAGVEIHLDDTGEELVKRARSVVKSPGVPQEAAVIQAAAREGLAVISELELGWRMTDGPVIAVTGTNGKTTSVEMVGHILREAGELCEVVGNVGTPLVSLAGDQSASATLSVEASSFQLEGCEGFAPDVAVLLNISADHLDRHGTLENYRNAKLKIFENQTESGYAVIPLGFDESGMGGAASRVTFGGEGADLAEVGSTLYWRGERLLDASEISLPGAHNRLNAQASAAACLLHGVAADVVARALATFTGVPHRLETVAQANGVTWVNDSKATNVGAAITALASFNAPVRLIVGGQGKGQDFSDLADAVESACASVHLIGEASEVINEALAETTVPVHLDGDLRTAVSSLAALAKAGDVVLLAPACASFDQFEDFEARGAAFCALVKEFAL